jgi:hypothetical protein
VRIDKRAESKFEESPPDAWGFIYSNSSKYIMKLRKLGNTAAGDQAAQLSWAGESPSASISTLPLANYVTALLAVILRVAVLPWPVNTHCQIITQSVILTILVVP